MPTAYTTNDENFFTPNVGHRSFSDLDQHSENIFLQGKAQVCWGYYVAIRVAWISVCTISLVCDIRRNRCQYS